MFLGTYPGVLSPKRRVAIPSLFRKNLGEKFIVAKWYEQCLVLVPVDSFGALLEKLRGETKVITRGVRDTERFILGSAFEVECDEQGRVVIPNPLVLYAALEKDIAFIGLGNRVEIWDSKLWQKKEAAIATSASEILEKLANENK
jgi:MraZ protein